MPKFSPSKKKKVPDQHLGDKEGGKKKNHHTPLPSQKRPPIQDLQKKGGGGKGEGKVRYNPKGRKRGGDYLAWGERAAMGKKKEKGEGQLQVLMPNEGKKKEALLSTKREVVRRKLSPWGNAGKRRRAKGKEIPRLWKGRVCRQDAKEKGKKKTEGNKASPFNNGLEKSSPTKGAPRGGEKKKPNQEIEEGRGKRRSRGKGKTARSVPRGRNTSLAGTA